MTISIEDMKANRKAWVEALRSGAYEQATETLTAGGGYCCLGVACKVMGKSNDELRDHDNLGGLPEVRAFFGIAESDGGYTADGVSRCLAEDNDKGASFSEIADTIESEPEGLFTDWFET